VRASAFLDVAHNTFHCSCCTPGTALTAMELAYRLGVPWPVVASPSRAGAHDSSAATFSEVHAQALWDAASARALDDNVVADDIEVYGYLVQRGLGEAFEERAFGIVAAGMPLPTADAWWLRTGHRLVVPLYDQRGAVVNIQARAIRRAEKKTVFPRSSRARGTLFASRQGLAVLRRDWEGPRRAVIGEGLTDFLGLVITSPSPVLSAPGAGLAASGIARWIDGFDVLLALDNDRAGMAAVEGLAAAAYWEGASRVRRVVWPGRLKDACEVIEAHGTAGLRAFLERELEGRTYV
jgi:hypothetical protein